MMTNYALAWSLLTKSQRDHLKATAASGAIGLLYGSVGAGRRTIKNLVAAGLVRDSGLTVICGDWSTEGYLLTTRGARVAAQEPGRTVCHLPLEL